MSTMAIFVIAFIYFIGLGGSIVLIWIMTAFGGRHPSAGEWLATIVWPIFIPLMFGWPGIITAGIALAGALACGITLLF